MMGQGPAPFLELQGVTKRYPNGTLALTDISLAVGAGEFLAIVGASGCGKSTILRHVAGLVAPTSGRIAWAQPAATGGIGPGGIGMVFQEPTLMPWARIQDNVRLPLDLAKVPRAEADARVSALLAQVGLADFARAYPRELSGGMKMRASIARALVTRPRLLLMDEPFAALDEITRQKLNDDLLALWREQRFTAMFVTHSVYEGVYLANRAIVMAPRPGRIHADIPLDLPYPRDEALRTDARYAAACRTVSLALAEAMRPPGRPSGESAA
ncbi:ABC transporter ATP-binding protein [Nitrospirillum amazonense]|uniref:NitT/TauT family transport system ATP-binding protein n=1 Tax=Nitrospirillum amazonense TaxID=28077 RepID=A0A560KCM0_9PROT|nr:ABC transporter ATP-binding protein [Nitrospirillum amazonense]MDG3441804.1 ABC transporter ATP-binding protein [Nitrospirillum amazonense]TWB79704.1 NitT/TauT family transport system ATP-binding protein [Nitrospirillum amazonense]